MSPLRDINILELAAFLDELTDEIGEDESHPLAGLMDVVGSLIESYEAAHVPHLVAESSQG